MSIFDVYIYLWLESANELPLSDNLRGATWYIWFSTAYFEWYEFDVKVVRILIATYTYQPML